MTDIVERLKSRANQFGKLMGNYLYYAEGDAILDREAAAHIDHLQGELERVTKERDGLLAKTRDERDDAAMMLVVAERDSLSEEVKRLREALQTFRSLVKEGGVPRYTITPGAALNTVIEEVVDPALREKQS